MKNASGTVNLAANEAVSCEMLTVTKHSALTSQLHAWRVTRKCFMLCTIRAALFGRRFPTERAAKKWKISKGTDAPFDCAQILTAGQS